MKSTLASMLLASLAILDANAPAGAQGTAGAPGKVPTRPIDLEHGPRLRCRRPRPWRLSMSTWSRAPRLDVVRSRPRRRWFGFAAGRRIRDRLDLLKTWRRTSPRVHGLVALKTFIKNGFHPERVTYEDIAPFKGGSLPPHTTSTRQYGSINDLANGMNSFGANIVSNWDSVFIKPNLEIDQGRERWDGEGHYILHIFMTGPKGIDLHTGKSPVRPN